jgi:hypothetical protein
LTYTFAKQSTKNRWAKAMKAKDQEFAKAK